MGLIFILKNADCLTRLQCEVNRLDGRVFSKGHGVLHRRICNVRLLDEGTKAKVQKLLDLIPQGGSGCHTDIHPGNIIIAKDGPRLIDGCDAMCDSLWLDIARMRLIFESNDKIPE